jgi:ABC-type multidrug transport system fused ATPase/permease subunit
MLDFHSMRIERVHFRYTLGAPSALDFDEPLIFEKGKIYVIVGQNRSGKSTLVKLILRLFDDHDADLKNQADIFCNDVHFSKISRRELRKHISYISQRPFIFEGTIAENIALAQNADPRDIYDSAKLAGMFLMQQDQIQAEKVEEEKSQVEVVNIKPWERNRREIRKFVQTVCGYISKGFEGTPLEDNNDDLFHYADQLYEKLSLENEDKRSQSGNMLDMPLDSGGSNVSGGFAQSIALARVFLRKSADVVILDEALGQMDAIKKREFILPNLFKTIRERNQTLIMITHDLGLVEAMSDEIDEVVMLEAGKVVARGRHQDLIQGNNNVRNNDMDESAYQRLFGKSVMK